MALQNENETSAGDIVTISRITSGLRSSNRISRGQHGIFSLLLASVTSQVILQGLCSFVNR